jgi:hypothetical protein
MYINLLTIIILCAGVVYGDSMNMRNLDWTLTHVLCDSDSDMRLLRRGDRVCFYTGLIEQPACCTDVKKFEKWQLSDVRFKSGDKINKKVCIKSGVKVARYIYENGCYENHFGERVRVTGCVESSVYTTKKYTNVRASCNSYGCLTEIGWVSNNALC